jgi:hypothetical protein
MTRGAGLTGASDHAQGIFSAWLRIDGGDGTSRRFFSAATTLGGAVDGPRFSLNTSNQFLNTVVAGASTFQHRSTTAYAASATWRHLLIAWDRSIPVSSLYVGDTSDQTVVDNDTFTADYTYPDWVVGATADGTIKFNGCLAELYFAPGQYLDFSVTANRRKFISAAGKPVSLGRFGEYPLNGIRPLVYQSLRKGEAVANFATNRGTGGNFSITGTLDTGSTSPSD